MKIIYFTDIDFVENPGVYRKVADKISIWEGSGHQVAVFCIGRLPEEHISSFRAFGAGPLTLSLPERLRRFLFPVSDEQADAVISAIKAFGPDCIYMRQFLVAGVVIKQILRLKGIKKILEINSEAEQEAFLARHNSALHQVYYYYIKWFKKLNYSRADAFVTVTKELGRTSDFIGDRPVVCIPNGINIRPVSKTVRSNARPQVVFMGTAGQPWHGVDEIVALAALTVNKLDFHIIGYEEPQDELTSNITFYGQLPADSYTKILLQADVAISVAALYRKKMEEACALKVREYILYSLPMVIPYKETIFEEHGYPDFTLTLPNKPRNLVENVEKILTFCERWRNESYDNAPYLPLIDAAKLEQLRLEFMEMLVK